MFTKSQLVATAVLVASASSVVASPIYSDVTEIEARGYTRDALTELKRRAILDYIEELEARDPTGSGAGAAPVSHIRLPNSGKSQQTSHSASGQKHKETTQESRHDQNTHIRLHGTGDRQTTAHSQHHLASGNKVHASERVSKKTGEQRSAHRNSNAHRLPAPHAHDSTGHSQALVKESSPSTHRHNGQGASAHSPASVVSPLKESHTGQRQSSVGSSKAIKRSVLEYLGDLVGRAPAVKTPVSSSAKGNTQSTPATASTKVNHPSSASGAHKETEGGVRHPSNVVGGHKEGGVHAQHPSNAANAHKEEKGSLHHSSSHHQTQDHTRVSKQTTQRTQRLPHFHSYTAVNRQRLPIGLARERTQVLGNHREPTAHNHRLLSTHDQANTPTTHGRLQNTQQHTSNHLASNRNGVPSHSSPAPAIHDQPTKQQSLKSREIEDLVDLITRELDLYDELD